MKRAAFRGSTFSLAVCTGWFHDVPSIGNRFQPGGSSVTGCGTASSGCTGTQAAPLTLIDAHSCKGRRFRKMRVHRICARLMPDQPFFTRGRVIGKERNGSVGCLGIMTGTGKRIAGTLHQRRPSRACGCKLCGYTAKKVYEEPLSVWRASGLCGMPFGKRPWKTDIKGMMAAAMPASRNDFGRRRNASEYDEGDE